MVFLQQIFTVEHILMMNVGMFIGIIIGAMPGLSVTFAVTVLLTFTFRMESLSAIYMLLGAYCGGIYGGSITAILLKTPGTPNAICTAIEGYPLAQKGRAGDAMKVALICSTIGGFMSCGALIFFAPELAKIILQIGAPEYFALCTFGMFASIGLEGTNLEGVLKGVMSASFGLLLACIGADPVYGTNRFSFGSYYMMSGVNIVSAMLGAYALCQLLENSREILLHPEKKKGLQHVAKATIKLKDILRYWKIILKSSVIGIAVGAVPGTGGAEAAMFAYNEARRSSKHPEDFGNGSLEGIAAAETANNATSGATMIPMLTLGVPGDTCMAILLSALIMQGVTPGANLFNSGSIWVYAIMGGMFVINIFMLIQGSLCINLFSNVSRIPQVLLSPCILMLCVMGAFAIENNIFQVFVMVVFGILSYLMKQGGFPITPMCIGLVLGSLFETNLRRSLVLSGGDFSVFLKRPLSCGILILSLLALLYPIISVNISNWKKNGSKKQADCNAE